MIEVDEAQRILRKAISERATLTSVRSFTKLTMMTGGRAYRGKAALLLERPNRFRIEFLGPFRHPRYVVAFDGERFTQRGETSLTLLKRRGASDSTISIMGLTPEWLVSSALGMPEFDTDAIVFGSTIRIGQELVQLDLSTDEADATMLIREDPSSCDVERFIWIPKRNDGAQVEAVYSDYEELVGPDGELCRIPCTIILKVPESGDSIRIHLSDPEVNVTFPPSLFRVDAPSAPQDATD